MSALLWAMAAPSGEQPRRLTSLGRRHYVFAKYGSFSRSVWWSPPPLGHFDKRSSHPQTTNKNESLLNFPRQRKTQILK